MKQVILKGKTDVTVYVWIPDSSSTTGAGRTGLAFDTASLVCYYVRPLGSATQLTLATQTVTGAHSDGGFVEVSSANMPGLYRLDLSDAICATGVDSVVVMLKGAANMPPVALEIQLTAQDFQDAVPPVDVTTWNGTAVVAPNTAGVPRVDIDLIEGANVATGTAQLGVNMVSGSAGAITATVIADAAIDRATFAADTGLQTTRSGTAQAGGAGTITLDASASATDDIYNDQLIFITGATGAGQARRIADYVGSSKVASVEPNWQTNPDSSSTFAIIPFGRVDIGAWLGSLVNALISGRVDSSAQATGTGAITAATFAAGAIDAAAIAADAIGSSELAASAATEVADAVWAKTMSELSSVPGVSASVLEALEWLFLLARNKRTCTATTETLRNNADGANIGTATVSDDGTTATRALWS